MTIYDAAMAVVLVGGLIRGAWRGITWQLASIGSLVLGYLFSYPISAQIAPLLPGSAEATRAMSMAAAYAVVSGGVFAVAWMVRGAIHKLKFDAYDRHLGMMLGGVEGAAVGILLTLLVVSVSPNTREPIFSSTSGKVVGSVMNALGPVLPGEVRRILEPFWNNAVGTGEPAVADQDQDQDQDDAPAAEPESPAVASEDPALPAPAPAPAAVPATPTVASKPARPTRTASPSPVDPSVFPVVGRAEKKPTAAPTAQAQPEPAPTARSVFDSIVDQGKQAVEQAVVETLDDDPDQKASSIRELVEKDKKRLQDAVSGVVGGVKQNVTKQMQGRTGQVQNRINQVQNQAVRARRQAEQKIDAAVGRTSQAIDQTIDQQFQKLDKLGGLEPAPEKKPQ
jgi:membrane protein required for colicin V production